MTPKELDTLQEKVINKIDHVLSKIIKILDEKIEEIEVEKTTDKRYQFLTHVEEKWKDFIVEHNITTSDYVDNWILDREIHEKFNDLFYDFIGEEYSQALANIFFYPEEE